MRGVELRSGVIQGQDRPPAAPLGVQARLRQQQPKRQQLGLPAREGLTARQPGELQAHIRTMGTDGAVARAAVTVAGQQQGIDL